MSIKRKFIRLNLEINIFIALDSFNESKSIREELAKVKSEINIRWAPKIPIVTSIKEKKILKNVDWTVVYE
jgi:hypothetical protein